MNAEYDRSRIAGVILAGGKSRRMGGGDKALMPLAGTPMIAHIAGRLAPQVGATVIVANGDVTGLQPLGLPIVVDAVGDYAGPLAGLLSGMIWTREHRSEAQWIATTPCDTPFLPEDYVGALRQAAGDRAERIVIAASEGGSHFASGLWPVALHDDLAASLEAGEHRMHRWIERHANQLVSFPIVTAGAHRIDPFFNVNTREDFEMAETIMKELQP
jgi:molybdopterin-guanine dinucleotide biosynthesis protein A